jgi:hypothetical protein
MLMAGVDGCVSVGELRYVWQRGMIEDRLCGCGEHFSTCPFWTDVVKRAGVAGAIDPRRMVALQDRGIRMRELARAWSAKRRQARLEEYPQVLSRVVGAIAEVAGARTVVDSSKLPPYGSILRDTPGVDLRVAHLVRDPRATAFSWGQTKEQPDRGSPGVMQQHGAWKAAALWTTWNTAAELLGRSLGTRYRRVRYEDFVATPEPVLRELATLIDAPDAQLPLVDSHRASLVPSHTVAGNPDRFTRGEVELRRDERWVGQMSRGDRATVTAIAAPLMARYGYSVSVPR